jgi:hypothetical protein
MRTTSRALSVLVLAACSGRDAARRPADSGASTTATAKIGACWGRPLIGEGGVGTVRVNRTIADLARTCVTHDTTFSLGEGLPETAKVVRYDGHEVVAVITGSRTGVISRVIVSDSAFHTAAGVGIGSTVGDLRHVYGAVCPLGDEEAVGVRVRGLAGVSFGVEGTDDPTPPDTAHVTEIWIYEPGLDAGARCGG